MDDRPTLRATAILVITGTWRWWREKRRYAAARRLARRTGGQVFAGGHAIYWPLDEDKE